MASQVPEGRIRNINDREPNPKGEFVVYWMTASRRSSYNFGLELAIDKALELGVPLIVLEALRVGYKWASDRFHQFIIEGMVDNQHALDATDATYYPYIEDAKGAGKGLLAALAKKSALVVTDDAPYFFLPRMIQAAGKQIDVQLLTVDSNGIYPTRDTERAFTTAASFRRHLQKNIGNHLLVQPKKNPFARKTLVSLKGLDKKITKEWPVADLKKVLANLSDLDIDHRVGFGGMKGGPKQAQAFLKTFLGEHLADYSELRNQPKARCQSFLSPYLHFGHISSHRIFVELMKHENWSPADVLPKATGSRSGWWGASAPAEAFLDQFITWRELGYNGATHLKNSRRFSSLPEWAQASLESHAGDEREYLYTDKQFEKAATHDALWNAAQRQLVREGTIHNYLRMLWGKKILEWTKHPKDALRVMIHLNNKYAYDGRNPNSYSGIFWTLGRYDRAWGPERNVFGKIRFMSSKNTARKVDVKGYLQFYDSFDAPMEQLELG